MGRGLPALPCLRTASPSPPTPREEDNRACHLLGRSHAPPGRARASRHAARHRPSVPPLERRMETVIPQDALRKGRFLRGFERGTDTNIVLLGWYRWWPFLGFLGHCLTFSFQVGIPLQQSSARLVPSSHPLSPVGQGCAPPAGHGGPRWAVLGMGVVGMGWSGAAEWACRWAARGVAREGGPARRPPRRLPQSSLPTRKGSSGTGDWCCFWRGKIGT